MVAFWQDFILVPCRPYFPWKQWVVQNSETQHKIETHFKSLNLVISWMFRYASILWSTRRHLVYIGVEPVEILKCNAITSLFNIFLDTTLFQVLLKTNLQISACFARVSNRRPKAHLSNIFNNGTILRIIESKCVGQW